MTSEFERLRREYAGVVTVEGFRLERLATECEYRTPGGATVIVPASAVTPAIDGRQRFGGYLLRELRYIRTIGDKAFEEYAHNLITNEGIGGIANMLIDASAAYDTGIKRVEIGTGGGSAVTPTVDDTTLVGGQVRFACNAPTQSAGVITVVTSATVAGGSNIFIREIGVFMANDTATISAGDLLDHAAYTRDNSGGGAVNLTITHTIDLSRFTGA